MSPVVDEAGGYLFLDKPAGVPVFPPHDDPTGASLLRALLTAEPQQDGPWPPGFEGGILHRLDGWTSGLVVAARTPAGFEAARRWFGEGRLSKRYHLLSGGRPPWAETVVVHPLAHAARDRRKMTWKRGGDTAHRGKWYEASTRLRLLERRPSADRWEAAISTGVMHQVRVHAASVGLPILGDRLYGGATDPRATGRFYLHHHTIEGWPGGAPALPAPEDWP